MNFFLFLCLIMFSSSDSRCSPSSSSTFSLIKETNDSPKKTANLSEFVICEPKKSIFFANIKKRDEKIFLLKLRCRKKKVEKNLQNDMDALLKNNDFLIYKRIRKFPYFKILKVIRQKSLSKCDLSRLELGYDINSSKFYEGGNDSKLNIKNEILKMMNNDMKKIPFFALRIQKKNQDGRICLLVCQPSININLILKETTFPKKKNLTISIAGMNFLLKTLKIKIQNNSYEFTYNNNASSRQINFIQELSITENQVNFLRIDFTFNKFLTDHRIFELKYEEEQEFPQKLLKNTSQNKRMLQNNPYIFTISPVDANHSTDPDCSILVIFFFLICNYIFILEFRIFFE